MKLPSTFSVFPVSGKKPLVNWAEFSKRQHTSKERQEWESKFTDCQWGIATGPVSSILVLDDDGGLDVSKYPIPNTWKVRTPRGGTHYYFKWTNDLYSKVTTKVEVMPKVDVRGKGGFVVFYGFEKPYFTQILASPPQWLIDLLPNKDSSTALIKTKENEETSNIKRLLDGIKSGNRNDSFSRIAGSLRARGYSSSDIYGILEPKAKEADFGAEELRVLTESIGRYQPKTKIDDTEASSIDEFLKDQEQVEWLVDGLISKRSIGFVVGLPETGKTWAMIDLAVETAKKEGGLWLNKFPVKPGKVLLIDQERFKGETQRRLKSIISGKNLSIKDLQKNLFIKCGTTIRIDLQNSFDAFKREVDRIRPDLIIIDSFVTFHTREENNRKDIQEVLEKVKEIRNEFGCTFLFIHHENKAAFNKEDDAGEPSISQMAGSIAIPAVAETVLTVRRQDADSSMVYHTKSTLSSTVPPFMIKVSDMNEDKTKIKVEAF